MVFLVRLQAGPTLELFLAYVASDRLRRQMELDVLEETNPRGVNLRAAGDAR